MTLIRIQGRNDQGHLIPGTLTDTPEGGHALLLKKGAGEVTQKGLVVCSCAAEELSWRSTQAADSSPFGIAYEDLEGDTTQTWVVVSGVAEVLLEDGTSTAPGNWVKTSDTQAGRADGTLASPPHQHFDRFKELGHALESKDAGVSVLVRCLLNIH